MRVTSGLLAPLLAGALVFVPAACSDDGSTGAGATDASLVGASPPVTTVVPGESVVPASGALPIVAKIADAVAALELRVGGPQAYFEINATAQVVNLFVALNNAAVAQPWLYIDGTLTSREGRPANGGTFTAEAIDFDPSAIFLRVLAEVPDVSIESFYINGDGQGNVLYGVLASSSKGGGFDIVLGADGSVKSVDPVS